MCWVRAVGSDLDTECTGNFKPSACSSLTMQVTTDSPQISEFLGCSVCLMPVLVHTVTQWTPIQHIM